MATVATAVAARATAAAKTPAAAGPAPKEQEQTHSRGAGALPGNPWAIPAEHDRGGGAGSFPPLSPQSESGSRLPIQRKLAIGAANDPLESEADAMAERVLRGRPTPAAISSPPAVRRKRADEDSAQTDVQGQQEKQAAVLRKAASAVTPAEAPPIVHQVLRSPGQLLDAATRSFMEPRFRQDFSRVRIHSGPEAGESARAVQAQAYTLGNDVVFAPGKYNPSSNEGKRLLAHELTHTIQQQADTDRNRIQRDPDEDAAAAAETARIARLDKEYDAELAKARNSGNWKIVAEKLEKGFTPEDIEKRLRKLAPAEVKSMHDGAVANAAVGADSNVALLSPSQLLGRSYAVVFPNDTYGQAALAFIQKYHPQHKILRPSSFEQLFELLKADIDAEAKKNNRLHVDQLMMVTHANRYGGLMVPLRSADAGNRAKFFTPANVADLQNKLVIEGKDKQFEDTRHFVVTHALDENTEIIVRGCEFGRDPQAPDALGLFFGGMATVWAPTDYQGYGPDAGGTPSSYYVKGLEEGETGPDNKSKLKELERQGKTFSPEAESLRIREEDVYTDEAGHQVVTPGDVRRDQSYPAGDHWVKKESLEIDALKRGRLVDIESDAKVLMNPYKPENASRLRVLRKAWLEHPEHVKQIFDDKSGDPLFGLFAPQAIFGDPDVIDRDARASTNSPDAFEEQTGLIATDQSEADKAKAGDFTESLEMGNAGQRKAAGGGQQKGSAGAGSQKPGSGVVDFSNDPAHITGMAPQDMKFGKLDLGLDETKADKPMYALAARGQFKRAFAIPVAKKLGILKNIEAEVSFEGTLAYAGAGQKQINIGGFGMLTTKSNDSTSQTGGRADVPLYKKKDDHGASISVKAGVEGSVLDKTTEVSGDKAQGAGRKFEVNVSTEIAWGTAVSSELKVTIFGIDSSKTGSDAVQVLQIKISPVIVTVPITFQCSDGSTATFTGKTAFSIKGEPDWVEIGKRLSQFLGRTVAAEAGAVGAGAAVGGAAGEGGFALETTTAITAGEAIITLGFAAVAAATIYAYVQEVKDIEDLKALKREASSGVDQFIAGYLSGVGYQRAGSGRLFNLGVSQGRQLPDQALERAKRRYVFTTGTDMTPADEAQVREMQKQSFLSDPNFPGNVRGAFEGAIRAQFYNAFKRKVGNRFDTLGGEYNIRAASGIPLDGDPNTDPDWSLIYDKGGPRKAPPGHY